jgi:tetratricopeptide (TPR) repeat protein
MLESYRKTNPASSVQPSPSSGASSLAPSQEHARAFVDIKRAIAEFDAEPGIEIALPPVPTEDQLVALFLKNASVLVEAKEGRLAFNILRNVLMRQPDNAQALNMMGQCLKNENRFEEALKCFRAYAKIEQTPQAAASVAEVLYLCERDEAALAAYRDVLKNVITDASLLFEIYKNVGNIHTRAGDFEAAEEFYDKAYTLRPQSDVLLVNYGTLEIQRGSWNEAVTRFRSAVEINPQSDRGWVGLALVHRTMGDLELAKANLQRALDINSANRTALRLAVDWASQDHDFGFSIPHLKNYVGSAGGEDAEMSFLLSRTLVQAGQFREARVEIERVLALDPAFESADSLARALDRHLYASAASVNPTQTVNA